MRFSSTLLRWRLFNAHKRLQRHRSERERADQLKSLPAPTPHARARLKPTDSQWRQALRGHKNELERQVRQGERIVAALQERLLRRDLPQEARHTERSSAATHQP